MPDYSITLCEEQIVIDFEVERTMLEELKGKQIVCINEFCKCE